MGPSRILQEHHTHHFPNGGIGVVGSGRDELQGPCSRRKTPSQAAGYPRASPGAALLPSFPVGVGSCPKPGPGRGGALQTYCVWWRGGLCWGWHPTPQELPPWPHKALPAA